MSTFQDDRLVDRSRKVSPATANDEIAIRSSSRRKFLGTAATAAMAAGVLGKAPAALAQSNGANGSGGVSTPAFNARVAKSLALRLATARDCCKTTSEW